MRRSPAGTRSFWRSMEATREPGDDLLSFNVSRKPRSRKGSRLTATRRTGRTALPGRYERAKSRVFFVSQKTACFSPQGQKGGRDTKKREGGTSPHSLKSFVFRGLSLLIGFPRGDTEKSGETIATPPKRGVPTGPDSGTVGHASIRPQGVAIVGIYPCGKARKRRLTAAEIKRRMGLWNCGRTAGN